MRCRQAHPARGAQCRQCGARQPDFADLAALQRTITDRISAMQPHPPALRLPCWQSEKESASQTNKKSDIVRRLTNSDGQ
jgi:hypothetical protein